MKIAIFGQFFHKNADEAIAILFKYFQNKNCNIHIEDGFFKTIKQHTKTQIKKNATSTFKKLDNTYNLLLSIGGDGTILRAITHVKDLGIPIVGINTGRLGFLATIQNENIPKAMDYILSGNYKISERSLLEIKTTPKHPDLNELNFALNEIAVSRKNTTSMITVSTKLNGEYLTSYWSDGLIVSTPTGSTGYSLSCGGPVIAPETESFVLTPIAPHNLNARPLVIKDSTEIELKVDGREDYYLVSLDSRIATLNNNATLTIKKAPFKIKMIELHEESFLNTLRKKLLWGEDRRN